MDIKTEVKNGVKIVHLNGQLDSNCVGRFRELVTAEVENDSKVLLDCEDLSYLDSSGLATLLNLHKGLIARDASLILCGLPEGILRVIRFTKLDKVLRLAGTQEEGIEELSRS